MTTADVVAALVAERYGPSLWWKAPEKTRSEEVAPVLRAMLLRATAEEEEALMHVSRPEENDE